MITLIIQRNADLTYSGQVKLGWRKYGIYYVGDWGRPIAHHDDPYYLTIAKGEGQTSRYFRVILKMFSDFKKQYHITEKCRVKLIHTKIKSVKMP